jgi:hypothetical protein
MRLKYMLLILKMSRCLIRQSKHPDSTCEAIKCQQVEATGQQYTDKISVLDYFEMVSDFTDTFDYPNRHIGPKLVRHFRLDP